MIVYKITSGGISSFLKPPKSRTKDATTIADVRALAVIKIFSNRLFLYSIRIIQFSFFELRWMIVSLKMANRKLKN